jgi:hypothetical protein
LLDARTVPFMQMLPVVPLAGRRSRPATMIHLPAALQAWGTPAFEAVLCRETAGLGLDALPLQQGLQHGSHAFAEPLQVIHLSSHAGLQALVIRVGVYFTSIVAGCSCADDPTPVDRLNEYCVLELQIDRRTALTTITLQPH